MLTTESKWLMNPLKQFDMAMKQMIMKSKKKKKMKRS